MVYAIIIIRVWICVQPVLVFSKIAKPLQKHRCRLIEQNIRRYRHVHAKGLSESESRHSIRTAVFPICRLVPT
jgi:hypothetical protein